VDLQTTPTPAQRRLLTIAVLLCVLLVLGVPRLLHRGASGAVVPPLRAPRPARAVAAKLVVYVSGAVRRPGLYRLEQGTRIADALALAGGARPTADLVAVNLAAPLADGEQIVVPRRGLGGAVAAPGGGVAAGLVHLNSATLEQLDALPGVGPVTAQKILDYRQQHGAFGSVDELDAIAGIGPARLETLRGLVAP